MTTGLPFWASFLLALAGTILTGMVALDIVPHDPPLWSKLAALAINTILWCNTVLGNRLVLARPTGEVVPMPPKSHVAIVADVPDDAVLPKPPPDPPKGVA